MDLAKGTGKIVAEIEAKVIADKSSQGKLTNDIKKSIGDAVKEGLSSGLQGSVKFNKGDLASLTNGIKDAIKEGFSEGFKGGIKIDEGSLSTLTSAMSKAFTQDIKINIKQSNIEGIDDVSQMISRKVSEAVKNALSGGGVGDNSTLNALETMHKRIRESFNSLGNIDIDDSALDRLMKKFEMLDMYMKTRIRSVREDGSVINVQNVEKEIDAFSAEIDVYKRSAEERKKAADLKKAAAEEEAKAELKAAAEAERAAKIQEKAALNAERQKVAGEIAAAKASVNKLLKEGYGGDNYDVNAVNQVKEAYANLLDMISQLSTADSERYRNAVPYLQEQAQKVKELADAENNAAKARAEAAKVESSRVELLDQVNKFMSEGSDAAQQNKQQLEELAAALSKTGQSAEDIKRLKKIFDDLQKSEKGAAKEMNGFVKGFDSILSRFTAANLVVKGFDWLVKQAKEMVTAVKEVDAAMTELKKVTDLTAEGYSKFYNDAVKTAHEIGSSVSDTINASAD